MGGSSVVAVICGVVGAALGMLLARPAYRLSVDADAPIRATCEACSTPLSWIAVRGCPRCGRRLGPPIWLLALVSGVACAGIGWRFGPSAALLPYLLFALLGVLLGAVDLACLRLPDVLVKPGFVVGVVLLGGVAAVAGDWWALLRALIAAAALFGVFLLLALLPGANLGYGDVKLAGLLGLFLGYLGWGVVLFGGALGFLVNAPVALGLLLLGRAGRKTELPFGPAMLAGAWLAIVGVPAVAAVLS